MANNVELRELTIGVVNYTLAIISHNEVFAAAWRCTVCDGQRDAAVQADTLDEAVVGAEAGLRHHHSAHHLAAG